MTCSALLTGLLANRLQSDVELKLQCLSTRKLWLTELGTEVGTLISNALLTTDTTDDTLCQAALFVIQDQEKDIDSKMVDMQTELKEYESMKETALEQAKEDAKDSFTIEA